MKKMRKLVPAFAMLMVAAIMMSTASFAWFSMNTSATASGMQVKAKTSGGLAIGSWKTESDAPGANDFSNAATAVYKNGDGVLIPVSHGGSKWFTGNSATINSATVSGAYTEVTTGYDDYYLLTKWDIKTLDETKFFEILVDDVTVSGIGGTTENTSLAKSLRVAIKAGTNWHYFAPQYTEGTLHYVSDASARVEYNSGSNHKLNFSGGADVKIFDSVSTTAQTIEVYVYFEGEDDNCKSAYAIDLNTLSVTISFKTGADTTP